MTQDQTIRGVGIDWDDLHLAELEPLLSSFIEVVEMHSRYESTPPYWFNEVASAGLLAGAAWRLGWPVSEGRVHRSPFEGKPAALEERRPEGGLFVRSPGVARFALEVRQVMGPRKMLDLDLRRALEESRHRVAPVHRYDADARINLVFVVPGLRAEHFQEARSIDAVIKSLVGADAEGSGGDKDTRNARCLLAEVACSTHAYVFPQRLGTYRGPAGKFYWPGVILVVERFEGARK